ncbi:MAG TPA: HAD family hydrolase [Burkholderiales bacterium]|nr:HAD family hydrolase [Burkholderiales bacterium]
MGRRIQVARCRAVFLDRDGVINRSIVRAGKPYPPATLAELELLPGVPDALRRLKAAGFDLIVVSNQPDVARGTTSRAAVEVMHAALRRDLPIDAFRVCYHDDDDHCSCRKPKPGLLRSAAYARGVALSESYMVGDRWRDVEAGRRAGCRTFFVDYAYDERRPERYDYRVHSLAEAASIICALHQPFRALRTTHYEIS